jgi:aconitate hydratase 2/2-methylisocitrate dehydratase
MLENFYEQKQKRKELGIPPLTLTKEETQEIVKALIKTTEANEGQNLKNLLIHHVAAGIDEASKVKSEFLYALALEKEKSVFISPKEAVFFLGTMVGGYNVTYLIELLEHPSLAKEAANQLKETLLIFDKVESVFEKMKQGNSFAKEVMESWANGEWFTTQAPLAEKIILTVFKVDGETTTDDLSPAPDAFSRSDIPYHALSMLKNPKEGLTPIKPGVIGPINKIEELKKKGNPIVYVGDVVGTGSSRKSATNSLIWHFGQDIPYVPNKRRGGFCFAEKIPPIFYNTQEDSGAFPVEMNVSEMNMGEVIEFYPYKGFVTKEGKEIARFELPSKVILDEVRVGGRVNLIIGKALTQKARKLLGLNSLEGVFNPTPWVTPKAGGGGIYFGTKIGRFCLRSFFWRRSFTRFLL